MSEKDSGETHHCILKINCSCKGCEKKLKKLLLKIQGVEYVDIDAEEGKVLVIGNVDPNELITIILKKTGKHAEICAIHKPEVSELFKKSSKKTSSSNFNNGDNEHGDDRNDNFTPSHSPHSKGNNGSKNMGHMVPMDPMMNNGGGYPHHHSMMQMSPSYGQQRSMTMAMMNQQNMLPHPSMMHGMPHSSMMHHGMPHPSMMHGMPPPSMMYGMSHSSMMHHGMPHPSMMHGIPPPSMMHGMPHSSMMHHGMPPPSMMHGMPPPFMMHVGSKPSNVNASKKKMNQFKEM